MKKIITALDGFNLSQSAIDYTVYIARYCKAHIVGVFLDDMIYHSYGLSELVDAGGSISEKRMKMLNNQDKETRDESVRIFQNACEKAGLEFSIHRDRDVAQQELLHESIYADLLIINSKEKFGRHEQESPTYFLRELLTDVQCPVLVVPPTYHPLQKLVMLYDGEPSSVYAIKIFNYLLSDLKFLQTEVVSVKKEDETLRLPDNRLMKEFMKRHLPQADYIVLKGDAEELIIDHLDELHQNALVVLGAYRRSRVSRWFKESMADQLLKKLKLPLFIAYNK